MKIPKKFKLLGHEFEVQYKDLQIKNFWGECNYEKREIFLDKEMTGTLLEATFLHELLHLILNAMHEFDLANNEKFISVTSELLLQVLNSMEYEK